MPQPPEIESGLARMLDQAKKDGLSPAELAVDLHTSRKTLFTTGCWSDTHPTLRALVIQRFLPEGFEDNLRRETDERVSHDLLRVNEVLSARAGCPEIERITTARETRRKIRQILQESP